MSEEEKRRWMLSKADDQLERIMERYVIPIFYIILELGVLYICWQLAMSIARF